MCGGCVWWILPYSIVLGSHNLLWSMECRLKCHFGWHYQARWADNKSRRKSKIGYFHQLRVKIGITSSLVLIICIYIIIESRKCCCTCLDLRTLFWGKAATQWPRNKPLLLFSDLGWNSSISGHIVPNNCEPLLPWRVAHELTRYVLFRPKV